MEEKWGGAWHQNWQKGQSSQSDTVNATQLMLALKLCTSISAFLLPMCTVKIMEYEQKKNVQKELKHGWQACDHSERNMDPGGGVGGERRERERELHLCWAIYAVDRVLPAEITVMSLLAQSRSNCLIIHINEPEPTFSWTFYWKPPHAQWTHYF